MHRQLRSAHRGGIVWSHRSTSKRTRRPARAADRRPRTATPVGPVRRSRSAARTAPVEFEAAFRIAKDCRYFLSNRTPYLIHIAHPDPRFGELLLPPLAERVMTGARLQPFEESLLCHRQRHEVLVRRYVETISLVDTLIWVAWLSLVLIGGIAVFDLLQFGTLFRPEICAACVIGLIVLAVVLVRGTRRELDRKRKASADGTEVGDIAFGIGGSYSDGNETARSARQFLTLSIVLTVGAILPAIGILVGTDANDYLIMDGGLRVKSGLESRMVARCIQITYTCVLSLFPALLFFQFDRLQAGSIRTTWQRALFRMDGRMQTVADIDATYGHAMYEASNNSEDSVRGLGGKNSPIVIATVLIVLGWTVLVIRTESFDFSGTTSAAQTELIADAAGRRRRRRRTGGRQRLDRGRGQVRGGGCGAGGHRRVVCAAGNGRDRRAEHAGRGGGRGDDDGRDDHGGTDRRTESRDTGRGACGGRCGERHSFAGCPDGIR